MTYDKHDCDLMCERLAAYIEGDLSPAERAQADQHLAECAACAEALVELRAIAGEAAQLPLLTPSRDLWAGIEARISTPVTRLEGVRNSVRSSVRRAPRRQWQFAHGRGGADRGERGHHVPDHGALGRNGAAAGDRRRDHDPAASERTARDGSALPLPRRLPRSRPRRRRRSRPPLSRSRRTGKT